MSKWVNKMSRLNKSSNQVNKSSKQTTASLSIKRVNESSEMGT